MIHIAGHVELKRDDSSTVKQMACLAAKVKPLRQWTQPCCHFPRSCGGCFCLLNLGSMLRAAEFSFHKPVEHQVLHHDSALKCGDLADLRERRSRKVPRFSVTSYSLIWGCQFVQDWACVHCPQMTFRDTCELGPACCCLAVACAPETVWHEHSMIAKEHKLYSDHASPFFFVVADNLQVGHWADHNAGDPGMRHETKKRAKLTQALFENG
eukprot:s2191_g7.t1